MSSLIIVHHNSSPGVTSARPCIVLCHVNLTITSQGREAGRKHHRGNTTIPDSISESTGMDEQIKRPRDGIINRKVNKTKFPVRYLLLILDSASSKPIMHRVITIKMHVVFMTYLLTYSIYAQSQSPKDKNEQLCRSTVPTSH